MRGGKLGKFVEFGITTGEYTMLVKRGDCIATSTDNVRCTGLPGGVKLSLESTFASVAGMILELISIDKASNFESESCFNQLLNTFHTSAKDFQAAVNGFGCSKGILTAVEGIENLLSGLVLVIVVVVDGNVCVAGTTTSFIKRA